MEDLSEYAIWREEGGKRRQTLKEDADFKEGTVACVDLLEEVHPCCSVNEVAGNRLGPATPLIGIYYVLVRVRRTKRMGPVNRCI